MMMIPRKHDFDLFDDVFGDSFFNEGASRLMKTDIKEKKNEYIIDIDLPGYEKEGIKLEIQDGYLTVHASVNKEENDEEKADLYVKKDILELALEASMLEKTLQKMKLKLNLRMVH